MPRRIGRHLLVVALVALPAAAADAPFTLGGYVEADWQWNFNRPSNGITHLRGFDNRHNTFTLANVALDAQWDAAGVVGRLTLQVGHTPSTYYLAEPSVAGAAATNASGPELWKYVQQAWLGYRFERLSGLTVTAGVFLSPIGPESVAVREDWNWSRSNLFFGLPYYHAGARATLPLGAHWAVTVGAYNGWNSVVDGNAEKSVSAQATWTRAPFALSLLYFGGVERPTGALEGRAWRHLFDAYLTWDVSARLSLLAHLDAGFEPNAFGVSGWEAGALYARFALLPARLFVAVRADAFLEQVPSGATPIFWPVRWLASATATLDYRPHERVSFRLEYRHDHAAGPVYFQGAVAGDGLTTPFVPNAASQDTLTLGATAWF